MSAGSGKFEILFKHVIGLALVFGFAQPALAVTTGVYIDSPPGDYIGYGEEHSFTSVSSLAPNSHHITVTFDGWQAEFEMPSASTFAVGDYGNAQRYPLQDFRNPGLTINSPHRGCGTISGWFRVHEVVVVANTVMKLAVDFVQRCESFMPPLYGTIRINSDLPQQHVGPYASAPPATLRAEEGEQVTLDGTPSFSRGATLVGYQWVQLSGPAVTLANAASPRASFTAPQVEVGSPLTFTFRLTVTDAEGLTDSIDVRVIDTDYGPVRTRAILDSATGDYIGQGLQYAYDEDDTTIAGAQSSNGRLIVNIDGAEQWQMEMALPRGETTWQPGTYAAAGRLAFRNPKKPGLDFHGELRGCNTLLGWFEIVEIAIVDNQVQKLAVDFVQNCTEFNPPLFGAIRINSTIPTDRGVLYAVAGADILTIEGQSVWLDGSQAFKRGSAPLQYTWQQVSGPIAEIVNPHAAFTALKPPANGGEMQFQLNVSDSDGKVDSDSVHVVVRGRDETQSYVLVDSRPGDPIGQAELWLVMDYDSPILLSMNEHGGPSVAYEDGGWWYGERWWYLSLAGPNEAPLAPGAYEEAQRFPSHDAGRPGLYWHWSGQECENVSGRFEVLAIEYVDSAIASLAVDFEQSCLGAPPGLGKVRYNIMPAVLPTAKAGEDQLVEEASTVTLDGTQSSDDVGVVSYTWTQVEGPAVDLAGANTAVASFTAPAGQSLTFRLEVTDTSNYRGFDTITVNVTPPNNDSDGDGTPDAQDAFPHDPTETRDSDGDGYGDNSDAYPQDPTRHAITPPPVTGNTPAAGSISLCTLFLFLLARGRRRSTPTAMNTNPCPLRTGSA